MNKLSDMKKLVDVLTCNPNKNESDLVWDSVVLRPDKVVFAVLDELAEHPGENDVVTFLNGVTFGLAIERMDESTLIKLWEKINASTRTDKKT